LNSNLKSAVLSGVKWLSISKLVIQLFRWCSTFWVIRQLDSHDYGVMAMVEIFAALFASINFLCIGNSIIRFKETNKSTLNALYTISLLIGLTLTLSQYFIAPYFSIFYVTPEAEQVLKVIAITYILDSLSVQPMAILAKQMNFKKLAVIDMSIGTLMPITVLIFAYLDFGYWALAIGHIINSFARMFALNIAHPCYRKLSLDFRQTKEMISFGLKNTASSILAQLNSSIDILIGGYFFTTDKIGSYQVGLQISLIPLRKISPELRRISLPAFSKINDDIDKTAIYFLKTTRLIALVTFPIFWGIGAISEPLINILLTDKWAESIIIIQILSFTLPLKLLNEITCSMLNALGRTEVVLKNTIISLGIFITCIYASLNHEIIGLASAWSISIILSYVILIRNTKPLINIKYLEIVRCFIPALLASLLMVLTVSILQQVILVDSAFKLIFIIISGALAFIVFIVLYYKKIIQEVRSLFGK
jgi:O-antigen/teichoic acid export membrane protein